MRDEYTRRFARALDVLESLEQELTDVRERMAELERAGFNYAKIHWRKPGMMELLHPTGSEYERKTGRRREYIGTDKGKQQTAEERIERFSEWRAMKGEVRRIEGKIRDINYAIKNVFRVCGQDQNLDSWGQDFLVPKNQVSPQSPRSADAWGQGTARSKNGSEDLSPQPRVNNGDSGAGDNLHPAKNQAFPTNAPQTVSPSPTVPTLESIHDHDTLKMALENSGSEFMRSLVKDLPG